MENQKKSTEAITKVVDNIHQEIQPELYEQSADKNAVNKEAEKELNAKILNITMKINGQYPELSKYIEEMTETIPDEKHPEITLKDLSSYYESLNSMLNKYVVEHPIK